VRKLRALVNQLALPFEPQQRLLEPAELLMQKHL
jgi:hypothetical protein